MESNERKIGEDVFQVTPLPALRAFALQAKIAPALARAISGLGEIGRLEIDNLDAKVLGDVMAGFFAEINADMLEHLTRTLLDGALMNGKRLFTEAGNPFDILLRGKALTTWRLLLFALEVNYPDFFALAGNFVKRRQPAADSTSPSPNT